MSKKTDSASPATANTALPVSSNELVPGPWQVGQPYSIRTVTMCLHGVLIAVYPTELVLSGAAWIADTGRFSDYTQGADPNEIEPFPQGETLIVGRNAIIDAHVRPGSFNKQK